MATQETINTTDAQYQTALTRWRQIRSMMRPRLGHYFRLPDDRQQAWRQKDPLLREMLQFAQRVGAMNDDDE